MAKNSKSAAESITVLGTIYFPKYEGSKITMAVAITDKSAKALKFACEDAYPNYKPITPKEIEDCSDTELNGVEVINTKSSYNVPVFEYATKRPLVNEDGSYIKIYHGAKAYLTITLSEYEYKKKKGVTNYLRGIILVENGKAPQGTSYESLLGDCEELPW